MKSILLKLAYWVNKKYGITVELEDSFNFMGTTYKVVQIDLTQDIDCIDELTIKSHEIISYLDSVRISK